MYSLIRPLRALVKGLCANDSSHQLAAGMALGMVIGLVPKGNLIAAILLVVLLSLKINRGTGLCSAFLFTWVGALLDPISHRIGWVVLKAKSVEALFTWMIDLPVIPWTSFNNTVVLGSFLLAMGGLIPLYLGSQMLFEKYTEPVIARLTQYKLYHVLLGGELATRWKV